MVDVVTSISKMGEGLQKLLTNDNVLYVVYFFAFFFTTYLLINTALQKGGKNPFVGKPGKVISLMITFIVSGAVFYGKGTKLLIVIFNSIGGFVFTLFFSVVFVGVGGWLFTKYKKENFNLAMFCLSFFTYIGSSLLLPHFLAEVKNSITNDTAVIYGSGGSVIFGAGGIVIKNILDWVVELSFLLFVIFGLILVFNFIFGSDVNSTTSIGNISKDKKSDAHIKRISDFKSLLNVLLQELKETNNHFNHKINLLNDLRAEIGRLRRIDGGKK